MYQLTQLASPRHRQRLPHAAQQCPAQRLLALGRATAAPSARPRRLRAQLETQTTHAQ